MFSKLQNQTCYIWNRLLELGFHTQTQALITSCGTIQRLVWISASQVIALEIYPPNSLYVILAAEDNLAFIINWLEEFPMYKDSDFFLVGESYAGIRLLT